jgi:hypothetical protein
MLASRAALGLNGGTEFLKVNADAIEGYGAPAIRTSDSGQFAAAFALVVGMSAKYGFHFEATVSRSSA